MRAISAGWMGKDADPKMGHLSLAPQREVAKLFDDKQRGLDAFANGYIALTTTRERLAAARARLVDERVRLADARARLAVER